MKNDEFNFVEIKNEREGFSNFEFGSTQNAEFTSYADNRNSVRDEVNDNPVSNADKKPIKEEKQRNNKSSKDSSNDSSKETPSSSSGVSSASSAGAGAGAAGAVAAVAAAAVVVTGIVSVGILLDVANVRFTPHETSIVCDFDITNNEGYLSYKASLKNDEVKDFFEKECSYGHNNLEFADLHSSTEYTFEVFKGKLNPDTQEYTYESIYSEVVSTLGNTGPVVLSFDSDGRQGTMSSFEVESNKAYTLPVSIFVPRDDEYFAGWKINGEGEMLQPGQTVSLKENTTLVAGWNKFPTEENTTTADYRFFSYFPAEPSEVIETVSLMGIDFQCQYTSYYPESESLQLAATGGFVSTSTPFGGPISKISITTDSAQIGVANYTVAYSEDPIYEKVIAGGETQPLDSSSTYTFNCNNPDARYFCLSNESGNTNALIKTIEFTYLLPLIENSFKVYFDANGGEGSFGPYTVRNTNREELPDIEDIGFEAPQGYEFSGWKVKGVNDLLESGTLIGISSDITLVAQWKPVGPTTYYTITFDPNGGGFDSLTNIEAELGEVVNLPDRYDLTNVIYPSSYFAYFAGWSEEPGGLDPVDYSYTVDGDTTLYAIWGYGYELYGDFGQFISCKDENTVTDISDKGSFLYRSFERVSNMFFMGNGDESYFSNVTETAQPIESVTVVFGGPITISVTFSDSNINEYNYDELQAHDYDPPQYDIESYEFVAPSAASDAGYRYFNISAAGYTTSTAIVSNIIIKYRQ